MATVVSKITAKLFLIPSRHYAWTSLVPIFMISYFAMEHIITG